MQVTEIFGVILPVGGRSFETAVKSVAMSTARDVGNGNPCETSLRHVCKWLPFVSTLYSDRQGDI